MAKYDDESPEFVLPEGLLVHIEKYAASIKSDQDLLNVCNRFHQDSSPAQTANEYFVPLAVKLHTEHLLALVFKHKDTDVTEQILQRGQRISSDFLEETFGELGSEKLPNDQNFLAAINLL